MPLRDECQVRPQVLIMCAVAFDSPQLCLEVTALTGHQRLGRPSCADTCLEQEPCARPFALSFSSSSNLNCRRRSLPRLFPPSPLPSSLPPAPSPIRSLPPVPPPLQSTRPARPNLKSSSPSPSRLRSRTPSDIPLWRFSTPTPPLWKLRQARSRQPPQPRPHHRSLR